MKGVLYCLGINDLDLSSPLSPSRERERVRGK
jgi:hypothetical protein